MIETIFTLDYEIYGDGEGSLKELVYEPTEGLIEIFRKWNARFVAFIEVAEVEMIGARRTDKAVDLVMCQIGNLHREGFEIGLHLHPQWYNAQYKEGKWSLDYKEYNLCTLPGQRINEIINRSITFLRNLLNSPDFTPIAFRAGNWLFQPSARLAGALADKGIRIDSSAFKGGVQRNHGLDYRPAQRNGYFWRFSNDINKPDPGGVLLELPTYTTMVPFWKMLKAKRLRIQKRRVQSTQSTRQWISRYVDYLRPWYPLKLDFCRMKLEELTSVMDSIISKDRENPSLYKPIVAIGHTKDLTDFHTVERFVRYLKQNNVRLGTFRSACGKCKEPFGSF